MKKILLIEDNRQILEGNSYFLGTRGYTVAAAANLSEAYEIAGQFNPDIIILDIMLPDGSGLDFLAWLRRSSDVPVLLLTGLSTPADMVDGLSQGADDYLTKPYDINVLLARIEALLRRAGRVPGTWEKGVLRLDISSAQAFLSGEDMLLTPKQFAILLLLARNEGRTISASYLYETVWNMPHTSDSNALWKQISHLKAKFADKSGIDLTVFRGDGYCLEVSE